MDNANKRKSEFLGVNVSTAQAKLRKSIIFKLVVELAQDICFQCNERIENIDELSIEHKKPWLDVDKNLFWDLDNIAFSHLSCNIKASRNGSVKLRKVGPIGTEWCVRCQNFKPSNEFGNLKAHWNGKHWLCRKCKSVEDTQKSGSLA